MVALALEPLVCLNSGYFRRSRHVPNSLTFDIILLVTPGTTGAGTGAGNGTGTGTGTGAGNSKPRPLFGSTRMSVNLELR